LAALYVQFFLQSPWLAIANPPNMQRQLLKVVYKMQETLTTYKEKGIDHFFDLQAKAALYHKHSYHGWIIH